MMVDPLPPALGPQAQPPALPASPAVARAWARPWWTIPGLRPSACLLALALGLGLAGPGAAWWEAEAVAGPGRVAAGPASAPAGRPAERRTQVAQAAQAAQAAAAPLAPRRLGQVGGYSGALAVRGSLAVFAMGRRLRSADLSDPARPTLLGEGPELADLVHDIALSGDLAVVAAGNAGLWLLDLSDPRRPRAVGSLATPGVARGVAVDGGLAYLAAGDAGLLVVDIARPAQPRLLAIADTPGDAGDVVVTGRHAFVADWTEGLRVFDVTDVRAPRQVAALGLETLAEGLLLQGDKLYVSTVSAMESSGTLLVDISMPVAPRRMAYMAEDRAVLTRGPFLFTLDAYGQVSVLVVTDPYQSRLVRRRKVIPGFEGQVVALNEIEGQALLVAVGVGPDGTGSIATIAIDDPVFMERKGQASFNDSPRLQAGGIALFGEHACVLDARAGRVRILELSPVHAPRQVGELALPLSDAARVVVDGRHAYLFDSHLVIVDLRDLTAPTFAHDEPLDLRISVEDLVVQDGYAYLAPQGERGLKVLDVSDPRSVSEVAEVVGIGGVSSVAVRQPRAYLASSTGLQVVDVSDPRAPRRLGQIPLAGLEWVELGNRQDLVYATRRVSDQHVLLAIDTSAPSSPRVVETMDLPEAVGGFKVSGDLAYVINSIDSAKKLWSIDLTLPLVSRTAQLVRTAWQPYDLATQEELLMIGNPYAGVEIFSAGPGPKPWLPMQAWLPYLSASPQVTAVAPELQLRGQWGGTARTVAISGKRAYLGLGPRVQVFNIEVPEQPRLLAESAVLPGAVEDLVVQGEMAYVATGAGGLRILALADAGAPQELGAWVPRHGAFSVAVHKGMVFMGNNHGLTVVDVNQAAQAHEVTRLADVSAVQDLALAGDHLFVAASGRLFRYDVSTPAAPVPLGVADGLSADIRTVAVDGDHAYLGTGSDGLLVLDVADPDQVRLVGQLGSPGGIVDIALSAGRLALADQTGGLLVVDPTEPNRPRLLGRLDSLTGASGLATAGSVLAVADLGRGLRLVDLTSPASPRLLSMQPTALQAQDAVIVGNLTYTVGNHGGLVVLDHSGAGLPRVLGRLPEAKAWGLAVQDGLAYLVGEAGLQVVDLADPQAPQGRGVLKEIRGAGGVVVDGNLAYLGLGEQGLGVVDIRDPDAPRIASLIDTTGRADGMVLSGAFMLLIDALGGGLRVLDRSQPERPREVAKLPIPGRVHGLAASGHLALLGDGGGGLRIVDFGNPLAPREIGFWDLGGWGQSFILAGDRAYLTVRQDNEGWPPLRSELLVLDVSTPQVPRLLARLPEVGVDSTLVKAGPRILAVGAEGIWMVDETIPTGRGGQ